MEKWKEKIQKRKQELQRQALHRNTGDRKQNLRNKEKIEEMVTTVKENVKFKIAGTKHLGNLGHDENKTNIFE